MFTWLNKQGVKSSEGFEIQSTDRFTIEYREGNLVVTIQAEQGTFGGGPSVSISVGAFARWDNYRPENSLETQAQMRANFVAAMLFQGIAVES